MTEKQYNFAWKIANVLGLQLPQDYSNGAYARFINDHIESFQQWQKGEDTKITIKRDNYLSCYEDAEMEEKMKSLALYNQGFDI